MAEEFIQPACTAVGQMLCGHCRVNGDHNAVPVLDLTLSTGARPVGRERADNQISLVSGRSRVRGVCGAFGCRGGGGN